VNRRGGLGKGLAALIPPGEGGDTGRTWLAELPIDVIHPNPRQPRDVFDDDELDGLAESIRDMGLLQPVVVRQTGDETYELVAGERRLRASKRAGLEHIPAVVRRTGDSDLLKEALVENIHRVQLNPLEEAAAYQQLLEDFEFTQDELAKKLGKSRPAISNALRLLQLPPAVQRRVAAGVVSAGHAKALLALSDEPEKMERMANRVVAEGMSVRALEETIRLTLLEPSEPGKDRGKGKPSRMTAPGLVELQHDLSDALGARVRITMGSRKGKLQVEFGSVDDLERIVGVIARGLEEGDSQPTTSAASSPPPPPPGPVGTAPVEVDLPAPDLPPPGGPVADGALPPADLMPTGPAAVDLPAPPTWSADAPDAHTGNDDDPAPPPPVSAENEAGDAEATGDAGAAPGEDDGRDTTDEIDARDALDQIDALHEPEGPAGSEESSGSDLRADEAGDDDPDTDDGPDPDADDLDEATLEELTRPE
jgi:ParB family transcriptional regulator, chromosome partitioning protein